MRRPGYKFTNKKHPPRGIMGCILSVISLGSIILAMYLTVMAKGNALRQYGTVILVTAIFSLVGLGLDIAAIMEKEIYRLFPILGIVLNALAIGLVAIILYAGVNGL